jgi:NAD(P)-dependent dehydrogenase (short-subunit alcohol dehydrogenase family)
MNSLKSKKVIITGASRGLGVEIAKKMWNLGADILLVARDENALKATIASLENRPEQNAFFVSADLSNPRGVEIIITAAQSHFDYLDILVNNAAIQGPIGVSWENDWNKWQQTITVNMLAQIDLSRRCSAWMITKRSGKIITLSGGGAASSRPNFSAYAVAKTGLVRFCEILAQELLPYNIQVNCIAPGAMATSMLHEILSAGSEYAGQKEYEIAQKIIEQSSTTLERAADLTAFLASSASDGITGKLISATWDPWETLPEHLVDLNNTDIYTLRRIVPKDRGADWGDR